MKKLIFAILVIGTFMSSNAMAIDSTTVNNDVAISGLNLQGDTLYLPLSGDVAIGMGTTIATAKNGLIELRGEAASVIGTNAHALTGIGIGVNVQKLVELLGGQWSLKGINASVFGASMLDFSNKAKLIPAIGITILKVNF